MFETIKELLSAKKSLAEKQELLASTAEALRNLDDSIAAQNDKLSLLETLLAEKESFIAEKNQYIAGIKEEAEVERQAVITKYHEAETAASEACAQTAAKLDTENKKLSTQLAKLQSAKTLYKAVQHAVTHYAADTFAEELGLSSAQVEQINELVPTTILPLQSDGIKDLRQINKETTKRLEETLARYASRYTTKSNQAIYQLMVIALRSELQNILTSISYKKLDACMDSLNEVIAKYLKIASDGSQTIAPTLNKFIAEIHILFDALVRTEYEYYVRKEQARAEQQALREQMRQDAEERKILEQQQKQVEKEESKYISEIANVESQLADCMDDEKTKTLQDRIAELQTQLAAVEKKKEEIISRQNGQAGYVYIISNLGAFGESTFKVGMTRRLDPMDRVKELGDASVPFSFDVHSFIFSDDAVGLESALHARLDDRRKNKVNLRKEFFDVGIEDLETLVQEINPSAEFQRTMLAAEFRQTQSIITQ